VTPVTVTTGAVRSKWRSVEQFAGIPIIMMTGQSEKN